MKVSISCITYNHGQFIEQTIQGFLIQKVNFELEIIIYNDASTDATKAIIEKYALLYPGIIQAKHHETNIGMMKNFIQALHPCTGQYIALCEGDDYWTDPLKLQKQVDYLESNPSVSLCFHPVYGLHGNSQIFNVTNIPADRLSYTFNDIIKLNIIPTCSVVYRNSFSVPDWFEKLPFGDMGLYFLCSKFGSFGLITETMAVYRINSGGVWTSLGKLTQFEKLYTFMNILYKYSNHQERREIKKSMKRSISHIMAIKYPSNKISRNFLKGLWYVRKNLFFLE
jgi:glycosyltransferase involved in cell wall biosynthesis